MITKLLNRFCEFIGYRNHRVNGDSKDGNDANVPNNSNSVEEKPHCVDSNLRRKGISVSVQVLDDRAHEIGPVIVSCPAGDRGIQGLNWRTRRLKIDEDGDVADEFLEIFPETSSNTQGLHQPTFSKFQVDQVKRQPAKPTNPHLWQQGP